MRNLGEALQATVGGEHAVIRSVASTLGDERAATHWTEQNHARPATAADRRRLARHAPRRARHAEVLRLHGAGASVSGIARHLDLDRKTVRCWLRRDEPPNWAKPARASLIDPHRPYEFIRRFLLHVLPTGFHRIRHNGLLASAGRRANLARIRELLAAPSPATPPESTPPPDWRPPCPCCGGRMTVVETFGRFMLPRGPPNASAPTGMRAA